MADLKEITTSWQKAPFSIEEYAALRRSGHCAIRDRREVAMGALRRLVVYTSPHESDTKNMESSPTAQILESALTLDALLAE